MEEGESDFKSLFKSVSLMSCPHHGNVYFLRVFHSTCVDGLGFKTKSAEREATAIRFACKNHSGVCTGDSFTLS